MKLLKLSLLLFAVATFTSCSLFKKAQAPKHDVYADTLSVGIYNRIYQGYADMSASPDKSFANWNAFYIANLDDISVLAAYDSTRKHSDAISYLVSLWKKRLQTYESEHSDIGNLNTGQIKAYQNGMVDIGKKVYLTESKLK